MNNINEKMLKIELQEFCNDLGIKYKDTDTKSMLIEAINTYEDNEIKSDRPLYAHPVKKKRYYRFKGDITALKIGDVLIKEPINEFHYDFIKKRSPKDLEKLEEI